VRRADRAARTLDERLSHVATDPEFWPLVRHLRAFRGIDTLSALILVLEVADFTRFQRAVQLGSRLGLVPSREQSGETDRHGSITKAGSKYARRILVEASWHYARPPRIGKALYQRQDGLPDHVLQIARRAQTRLYRVHKRMRERKEAGNVITVACARELACFLWAAATAPLLTTTSRPHPSTPSHQPRATSAEGHTQRCSLDSRPSIWAVATDGAHSIALLLRMETGLSRDRSSSSCAKRAPDSGRE
jgi:hypothetical protein